MDLGLKNKVAIVAAASKGLGYASALSLAQEGATVVICSRTEKEVHRAAEEIQTAAGSAVMPVVCDLAKADDVERLVEKTVQRFGTIHVLVNNAGGPPAGSLAALTDEQWFAGFELTMMSTVRLTRAVLPFMIKQSWGRIITITSLAAKQPINELLLSSSIRPGIAGLSKVLANFHAHQNITVNTICPGYILTARQEEFSRARASQRNQSIEEYLREQAHQIPASRLGRPDEIGNVVAFLASEPASYVNGVNLLVDGGLARGIH